VSIKQDVATGSSTLKPAALSVIDCDVHPIVPGGLGRIFPYLSSSWRQRFEPMKSGEITNIPLGRSTHFAGAGASRTDAIPPSGGPAGSDPEFMRKHYLDAHNVEIALLLSIQASRVDTWLYADDAAAVAAGYNDLIAKEWLATDPRFRMAMVVAPQDGNLGAAEIRRFGKTRGVVGVWIPLTNTLLGDRHFYPIYEAALEAGLPIIVHTNGSQGDFVGSPAFAGGNPSSKPEKHSVLFELGMSNLASLIFEGVFERFKGLKVLLAENGWTWIAPLMWRMDATWKSGRTAVPWVQKAPSRYILENVRFTTQPALEVPNDRYLTQILDMISGADTLLFSSDYPHWDADDPEFPFRNLPADVRRKIFRDNAIEFFGSDLLGVKSKP
jgi:predicted TIM-barrel fold metal-dependent hydrolase